MAYRQLKARDRQEQALEAVDSQLSPEQMAAYVRQSTTKQARNNLESADLQLSGAQKYAVSQGLDADKIVVAHEGNGERGVSGSLRIDQREKLRDIMADIKAGKIKVVWAYSVSRLFRDRYGVQVGTFVEICAKYGVKVVIETAQTFDFTNQMDVLIFSILANVAAKENDDRARLMSEARANKAKRGQYDGRPLKPGYIVDRDKKSPTYGRYIEYLPHAEVTRHLYARYRQLGGQFNLLAREVELMPVVFPDFDDLVDPLNKAKLRLRKVPGGYHISRQGLMHLLTSVEYAGYWVYGSEKEQWREILTDESGQPVINHEPIVDRDDWEYAFSRLSYHCLDGSPNPNRIDARATWQASTVKGQDKEPQTVLQGLLTSPLGTVHYFNGMYYVTERRNENTNVRSNTLTIDARWLVTVFNERLFQRIESHDYTQMLADARKSIEAKNAQALVSVDEQIKNYEASIRNKQEGLATLIATFGSNLKKETAQKLNDSINEDMANLSALMDKKNAAFAEERSIRLLHEAICDYVAHHGKLRDTIRRFIQLATDAIILDEYSSHFLTLTIKWSAPFQQTDVCYFYREDGGKQAWSEQDEADLRKLYPSADRLEIMRRFPTKTWLCILSRAQERGIERKTKLNTSGITNRLLSLADWALMQKYGWNREKAAHWLIDVPTSGSDDLSTESQLSCILIQP